MRMHAMSNNNKYNSVLLTDALSEQGSLDWLTSKKYLLAIQQVDSSEPVIEDVEMDAQKKGSATVRLPSLLLLKQKRYEKDRVKLSRRVKKQMF